MKKTLLVDLPNGKEGSRTTEHAYTHAVVAFPEYSAEAVAAGNVERYKWPTDWYAVSWHHDEAAARKAMSRLGKRRDLTKMKIVPVK